jgi:uncharacterized transporter YbjL
MIGVVSLLLFVLIALLVTRIATVALRASGRRVGDLQLAQEGVVVLGVRHSDGHYVGVPPAGSSFQAGDTLVVYGRSSALHELQDRKAGATGELAHERAITEHSRVVAEQTKSEAGRWWRRARRQTGGLEHADSVRR